ncbi:MAG: hypothetical protein ACFFE1_07415 [Candidatus Thorarchaeota archaeon]
MNGLVLPYILLFDFIITFLITVLVSKVLRPGWAYPRHGKSGNLSWLEIILCGVAFFGIIVMYMYFFEQDLLSVLNDPRGDGILYISIGFGFGVFFNIAGYVSARYLLSKFYPTTKPATYSSVYTSGKIREKRVSPALDWSRTKKEFIWYCPKCFSPETKPLPERISAAMQFRGISDSLIFKDMFGSNVTIPHAVRCSECGVETQVSLALCPKCNVDWITINRGNIVKGKEILTPNLCPTCHPGWADGFKKK